MALLTLDSLHKDVQAKHATLHNNLARTQRELNQLLANHAEQLTNLTADCSIIPQLVERANHLGEITQDIQERVAIMLEALLSSIIRAGVITQEAYDEALETARADYEATMLAEAVEAGIIHPVADGHTEVPVPRGLGNNETEDPDGGAQAPVANATNDDADENAVGVE